MRNNFFLIFLLFFNVIVNGQGIEAIIVEKYFYTSETLKNNLDSIPAGSVTYRIYADMAPGYKMQAIFGIANHPMRFKTTTTFFNSRVGSKLGNRINNSSLELDYGILDSWLTIGAASHIHIGVPKEDDTDGSVSKLEFLKKQDGLSEGKIYKPNVYNLSLDFFDRCDSSDFITYDGVVSVDSGVSGPTTENKVLIAQLTTNGKLYFEINLQLLKPQGGYEQYVAKDPKDNEIQFDGLMYNQITNKNEYDTY